MPPWPRESSAPRAPDKAPRFFNVSPFRLTSHLPSSIHLSGLVLAVGLLKKGMDVLVLERDLTAIRGEGKYRGPIQVRREREKRGEKMSEGVVGRDGWDGEREPTGARPALVCHWHGAHIAFPPPPLSGRACWETWNPRALP